MASKLLEIKISNETNFSLNIVLDTLTPNPEDSRVGYLKWKSLPPHNIQPRSTATISAEVELDSGEKVGGFSYKIKEMAGESLFSFSINSPSSSLTQNNQITTSISPSSATGPHWFLVRAQMDDAFSVERVFVRQYPNVTGIRELKPLNTSVGAAVSAIVHPDDGDSRAGCVEIICPEFSLSHNSINEIEKRVYVHTGDGEPDPILGTLIFDGKESAEQYSFNGVFPRKYTGVGIVYELIIRHVSGEKTYAFISS